MVFYPSKMNVQSSSNLKGFLPGLVKKTVLPNVVLVLPFLSFLPLWCFWTFKNYLAFYSCPYLFAFSVIKHSCLAFFIRIFSGTMSKVPFPPFFFFYFLCSKLCEHSGKYEPSLTSVIVKLFDRFSKYHIFHSRIELWRHEYSNRIWLFVCSHIASSSLCILAVNQTRKSFCCDINAHSCVLYCLDCALPLVYKLYRPLQWD